MKEDLIPANDGQFTTFQKQFVSTVAADPAKYGVTADDVTGLQTAQAAWETAYAGHLKAQEDARTATQTKETVRGKFEMNLRGAARKINGHVGVDNAMRVAVGLQPRDEIRGTIGAPTTRPIGRIEPARPYSLVLHFVDHETPLRTAKPPGVQGCQIWAFNGDSPPTNPSDYDFIALDTRTPYIDEHPPSDAGKTIFYLLRWQNAKGETGPWSEVIKATIPT